MAEKFNSVEDSINKMEHSIVKVGDTFRFASGYLTDGDQSVYNDYFYFRSLNDADSPVLMKYTDPSVSFENFELGCFSRGDYFTYLCRIPHRANNVGLQRQNTDTRLSNSDFYSRYMLNCLLGLHPSYDKVAAEIFDMPVGTKSAFHRHAWLYRTRQMDCYIMYMGTPIALLSSTGKITNMMSKDCRQVNRILSKIGVVQ